MIQQRVLEIARSSFPASCQFLSVDEAKSKLSNRNFVPPNAMGSGQSDVERQRFVDTVSKAWEESTMRLRYEETLKSFK
jgi:hypothetical protein